MKRGLCWPTENVDQVFPFTKPGSKLKWLYNWSPAPTPNSASIEFVPMQWNNVNIHELHDKAMTVNAAAILGFNEPELPDQSNMSPELAAKEWLRWMEPLRKSGVRVGSPGISSAPQGVGWLQDFLRRVRQGGGDIDFYCFHWYGETLGQFYDYIWSTCVPKKHPLRVDTTLRASLANHCVVTINLGRTSQCGSQNSPQRELLLYLDVS